MTHSILTIQDLAFVALPHTPIFQSISCVFQSGDVVCILGNNGSGKSSFLKVCAGLWNPTYGRVTLNQVPIHALSLEERSQKIAWLPQMLERIEHFSGFDFMNLTSNTKSSERYDWKNEIEQFELKDVVKKDLTQLSGGEWKRLQLAKIWSHQAPFLLLDEPESHLDLRHKILLAKQCKTYAKETGGIVFIVTHEMGFAKEVAEYILAFQHGLLVWNSSAHEFWQSRASLKLFGVNV